MSTSGPKKIIAVIGLATLLSGFSLASILVYSEPETAGFLLLTFLYLSVFLLACGSFTLLGLIFRRLWFKGIFVANMSASVRQAILLSVFLVFCLLLSSFGLLYWWVSLSLFLPIASLEAFLNLKV